jgi:class 3 adenylate cyclase
MHGCDWSGSAVNVAARLASEAAPNEALVSATTREAARTALVPRLDGCRELALRGVERPIAVWRLA